jgi:uncharacterized UBP type Zn finger protein
MQRTQDVACPHVGEAWAEPRSQVCEECGSGFNLRACTACGHVGCCESQQAHNTRHAQATGHPVIRSLPISEHSFTWCYECARYL